jgi:threonine/homoserine/homoserine lactone efflux protein
MDLQAAITLFLAVLGLAVKPGPGMMAIMSRTLAQGMTACLTFMAGVSLVTVLYLCLVFAGMKFAQDDLLFISIMLKALSAAYLIYLGIKGLQNPDVHFSLHAEKAEKIFDNFTASVMLTLSNPLVIVFYGVLLPSILDIASLDLAAMFWVIVIVLAVEIGVAVMYCWPIAYARDIVTPKLLRNVSRVSSVVLIVVGLVIGLSAMPAKDILLLQ